MSRPAPTPASLWSAAYAAEHARKWAEAADLYQRGLDAFKPKPLSQLDARLVTMRTEARDRCLAAAREVA